MTAYTNPRLHNRPPVTELEPPRPITEFPLLATSGWRRNLVFDAHCELDGLNWFRVEGGFGRGNDREDWIAELPTHTLSVTGWHVEECGGDLTAEMRRAVHRAFVRQLQNVAEARAQLQAELEREQLLHGVVERMQETNNGGKQS